jgi:hypothetical protein
MAAQGTLAKARRAKMKSRLFIYAVVDHCTGWRVVSQMRSPSRDYLVTLLRSVYGAGLEIISIDEASP